MQRIFLVAGAVVIVGGGIAFFMYGKKAPQEAVVVAAQNQIALAPAVEAILADKTQILQAVSQNETIIQAARNSNEKNKSLDEAAIQELDNRWISAKEGDAFVEEVLSNAMAKALKIVQAQHPEFKEIFVADAKGLNVGSTDKTSDYYQADESWWVNTYAKGLGNPSHGDIEFDASSQAEAIAIYFPIMDGSVAIGVGKAVLDLKAIKEQL